MVELCNMDQAHKKIRMVHMGRTVHKIHKARKVHMVDKANFPTKILDCMAWDLHNNRHHKDRKACKENCMVRSDTFQLFFLYFLNLPKLKLKNELTNLD